MDRETWQAAIQYAHVFLDRWAETAAANGFTAGDLFDVGSGLVWRMLDSPIIHIDGGIAVGKGWRAFDRKDRRVA